MSYVVTKVKFISYSVPIETFIFIVINYHKITSTVTTTCNGRNEYVWADYDFKYAIAL